MSSIKDQFHQLFELPAEIVLDAPLIMMVGQKKIYLENHKGIALYQADLIKVRINSGFLIISGQLLEIEEINTENLSISGTITGIKYEK